MQLGERPAVDHGVADGHRRGVATFDHREFPPDLLVECKGERRISVCIPARDEARTIGPIVESIRIALIEAVPLVDELMVVDDGSIDSTAQCAAAAGALVVDRRAAPDRSSEPAGGSLAVGPVTGAAPRRAVADAGKGGAMAHAAAMSTGDIVVFLDGDVENFRPHFVTGLLGPLLVDGGIQLVKGTYERPLHGQRSGGGRVTELVARPLISLLFPSLLPVRQPLAGETAIRRQTLDSVVLASGYGVEMALLIDVAELCGVAAIAQVDLGVRVHRNRPLEELAPQARDVLRVALERSGSRVP